MLLVSITYFDYHQHNSGYFKEERKKGGGKESLITVEKEIQNRQDKLWYYYKNFD